MKKLDFSVLDLCGRSSELTVLQDAYRQVADPKCTCSEAVLVHGHSGTGKSTLVRKLHKWIKESDEGCGYFVSGKFDKQRARGPYHALAAALNKLCDIILESGDKDRTIACFKEAVGSKGKVLLDVVPRLSQLLGDMEGEGGTKDTATAFNQLKFVFREFVRSVCTVTKDPVVLFLDDLQWADAASLELVKSIVTDSKVTQLLFVGAFRDNEIDDSHPLAALLREIESERDVRRIPLGDFDKETVNNFISRLTELDPLSTHPLTDVVYQKTHGNIFFVIQFLRLLQEEEFLYFSMTTYKWTWDMDKIKSGTDLSDNVVELVADKIERLPAKARSILKLASCLWSTFDVQMLQEVLSKRAEIEQPKEQAKFKCCFDFGDDLVGLLDIAAGEGLLDKLNETRYKFAHDRIQQAAYSLIPEGRERDLLHHWIGELLWQMTRSPRQEQWMYFAAADQINRGSSLIIEKGEKADMARLNLQVAEKAIALSAFVPAASYLKAGIDYLSRVDRWAQHYTLCLQLHNALAEMESCTGDADRVQVVVDEVLAHATSFRDKIGALYTLAHSLFAKGDQRAVVNLSYDVLRNLGEPVPRWTTKASIPIECLKLRQKLRRRSDHDLLAIDLMDNDDKIAAMKFYDMAFNCWAHMGKMRYASLVAMKMMGLSLNFGMCKFTPMAYFHWGEVLVREGNIQEGYRFGKLAVKLSGRLGSDCVKARVTAFACIFLNHWLEPLQQNLDPLLEAHKTGMIHGETTWAFVCILGYQVNYFYGGLPLESGTKDLISFSNLMQEYKHHMARHAMLPVLQCMLNLMGRSENVLQLTGEVMDQREYENIETNPDQDGVQAIMSCRMQLAYYFGDLNLAAELSKKLQRVSKDEIYAANYFVCARKMFFGLISIALARKTKRRKHAREAAKFIRYMENKWVRRGAVNCLHKLLLLKAEYTAFKNRREDEVQEAYDNAISTSRRVGFIQDEALANERAGMFFLRRGDEFWASSYLSRAHELYGEWGAQAKVEQLENQHGSLLVHHEEHHASHLRGRERFFFSTSNRHKKLRANELMKRDPS